MPRSAATTSTVSLATGRVATAAGVMTLVWLWCSTRSSALLMQVVRDFSRRQRFGGYFQTQRTDLRAVKYRRRTRPYVETQEEQLVRQFWEVQPFETATRLVDSVLANDGNQPSRLYLKKIPIEDRTDLVDSSSVKSGFEALFDPIYVCGCLKSSDEVHRMGEANALQYNTTEKMRHFRLQVAYRGDAFCGWQVQTNNKEQPSVQGALEDCLTALLYPNSRIQVEAESKLVNDSQEKQRVQLPNKKQLRLQNELNRRASLKVAGRTDAGVHAIGQICRVRTFRQDITAGDIYQHLHSSLIPMGLPVRVTDVQEVTRVFHPSFTSSCRAYVYLVDVVLESTLWKDHEKDAELQDKAAFLNAMLQQLEGKELRYIGLSYGKLETRDSKRTLYHARAKLVHLVGGKDHHKNQSMESVAICIELVGNGFLRQMVRLLVECAFQLVAHKQTTTTSVNKMALLEHVQKHDRKLISAAAPPNGLIFVGALDHGKTGT